MSLFPTNKEEILKRLDEGVTQIFQSDEYREYLKTMAKFYNYSCNNSLLIYLQRSDASLVAGYKAWQTHFGRYVRKGETAIRIFAPLFYKENVLDPSGRLVEVERIAFRTTSVFDISQTEGKDLPDPFAVREVDEHVEHFDVFSEAFRSIATVPISFKTIEGGAEGYFLKVDTEEEKKGIYINKGLSQMHQLEVIIHEITHSRLHDVLAKDDPLKKTRSQREIEAESVAYVVCTHFGVDTSGYSFGYVAGWSSSNPELLKQSLETVQKESSAIITEIEKNLEKYKDILLPEPVQAEYPDSPASKTEMPFDRAVLLLKPFLDRAHKLDPGQTDTPTCRALRSRLKQVLDVSDSKFRALAEHAQQAKGGEDFVRAVCDLSKYVKEREQENER